MGNGLIKEKNKKIVFNSVYNKIRKINFIPHSSSEKSNHSNFDSIGGPPGIRGESKKKLWN